VQIHTLEERDFSEGARTVSHFFIPKTVKRIGPFCFHGWERMSGICFELHSQIQLIGEGAFAGTQLRSIFVANGVTQLGESRFSGCESLWIVSFEMADSSLRSSESSHLWIGGEAFRSTGLRWIEIPARVFSLGDRCFHSCTSLSAVHSCTKLSSIRLGKEMFANSPVNDFHVGESVTGARHYVYLRKPVLPASAFESSSLSRIIIDAEFTSIRISCFERCCCLRTVSFRPACQVKKITSRAFSGCGLSSIVIPQSVEYIGSYSFASCPRLTDLLFESKSRIREICDFAFLSVLLNSICLPASISWFLVRHLQ
jgi:hypothetical protein